MLHRALEVCGHHPYGNGRTIGVIHARHVDGTRWVQSCKHAILFGVWGGQRLLRPYFLLNDALLHEVLVDWVAQRYDATSQPMWVVLRLQLHLLLSLVHLDCLQTVLVQVRRLIRHLHLLLLQQLLLLLIFLNWWEL